MRSMYAFLLLFSNCIRRPGVTGSYRLDRVRQSTSTAYGFLYSTRRLCYDPPSPTVRKRVAAAASSGYQKRSDDVRFEWAVSATAAAAAGAPSRQSNGSAERVHTFRVWRCTFRAFRTLYTHNIFSPFYYFFFFHSSSIYCPFTIHQIIIKNAVDAIFSAITRRRLSHFTITSAPQTDRSRRARCQFTRFPYVILDSDFRLYVILLFFIYTVVYNYGTPVDGYRTLLQVLARTTLCK